MDKRVVQDIRNHLILKLEEHIGEPVLLDLPTDVLCEILFYENDVDINSKVKKEFALDREILKEIDFSNVPFDEVDIDSFDFTGFTGVKINPQTVYGKSIFYTKLNGVTIIGGKNAYEGVYISGADFTGALGNLYINPQTVLRNDLEYCVLNGVTFDGSFDNVKIHRTDFTGSKGAVINPQTISEKSMENCTFKDVTFNGEFSNVSIDDSDFTGSKDAVINLCDAKDYNYTDFSDAIILVDEEKCDVEETSELVKGSPVFVDFEYISNLIKEKLNKYSDALKTSKDLVFNVIREEIRKTLDYYNGKPIKFNLDKEILSELLFEDAYKKKTFAFEREHLMKIDFSNVPFDGVNIENFDFTGLTGVKINPQTVLNKRLYGCKFEGVEFIGGFDGCVIGHSDFTKSKGAVINPQTIKDKSFVKTTLNCVTFSGSFDDCYIIGANFTGSKGALIDPTKVFERNLSHTKLCHAHIVDNFNGVSIEGTIFKGSKGIDGKITINPELLFSKNLSFCVFDGVTFTGSFDGCTIDSADFSGSKGALIDPSKLYRHPYNDSIVLQFCKFKGVEFTGPLDNCDLTYANFKGSVGAVINPQTIYNKNFECTFLEDVTIVDDFSNIDVDAAIFGENVVYLSKEPSLKLEDEKIKKYYISKINSSVQKSKSS